jgi:hypothetical protein
MTAVFAPPASVPYNGNYAKIGIGTKAVPLEGQVFSIPGSINWATDGGANNSILFNAELQAANPLSQIGSLIIDNRLCLHNVTIYFPDTQFKFDVPGSQSVTVPVVTNGLQFYIICPTADVNDMTFFQVLNVVSRPQNFPAPTIAATPGAASDPIPASGTQVLVLFGNTANVILTAFQIWGGTLQGATRSAATLTLSDNTTTQKYWSVEFTIPTAADSPAYIPFIQFCDISGIELPLSDGLSLTATILAGSGGGTFGINFFYLFGGES